MSDIIFIEFNDDGRPFAAAVRNSGGEVLHFDIEYCKRDDTLYADCSGGGVYLEGYQHQYWLAGSEHMVYCYNEKGERVLAPPENRLAEIPEAYQGDLWDWAIESQCIGCSACEDILPAFDLCQHVWWDDEAEGWSTPDSRAEEGDQL